MKRGVRGAKYGGKEVGLVAVEDRESPLDTPSQSPIYHAYRAAQYARQELISRYEREYSCRLVVMIDRIIGPGVTMFEELIYDADAGQDLHLLLQSRGGDGEAAIRMVRAAQSRCRELTVIVPDQAKSAATLLCLGAHHIMMGASSDLGPVDPQLRIGADAENQQWVAAKDIIAAVDYLKGLSEDWDEPSSPFPGWLLGDITAIVFQEARSALARSSDQLGEALKGNPDRTPREVTRLKRNLKGPMIEKAATHGALFGADDAIKAGLSVIKADPAGKQWQMIWRLWAKYFSLGPRAGGVYENAKISQVGFFGGRG